MFFKAVARCQASATKCQASGATSIFLFVFLKKILDFFLVVKNKKKQRRERKKEGKFFLLLYSSTSLFLFLFYSCDFVFFLIGIFFL
jgi:hypothetical protein